MAITKNSAAVAIIFIETVLSVVVIIVPQEKQIAVLISSIYITIIIGLFLIFIFSMASDVANRKFSIVMIFASINILTIISIFGNLYRWIGFKDTVRVLPHNSYPIMDGIYFSVVTWTTLGYGDIVPCPEARVVAAIEALTGYTVMGLLIAVLISMMQYR